MSGFLVVLIVGCALAAATALVRGLLAFLRDTELVRNASQTPLEARGVQQNRMMSQRVFFQGLSILFAVLIGAVAGHN